MNRQAKKRLIAILLCVCFTAGSLLAMAFIIEHADHDCSGHDCSVCAQIHSVGNLLKQLGILAACFAFTFTLIVTLHLCRFITRDIPLLTPVTLKIRMNH